MTSDPPPTARAPASAASWRAVAILLAIAFCACWTLGFDALGWGSLHSDGLLFELIARKDRAARETPSPKVLFLSGSSLLFGLDAPTLSRDLGVPVLNDALVAPLGIDLIAERAAAHVGPGDVVVIAPEWALFVDRRGAIKDDLRLEYLRRFGTRLPNAIEPFPKPIYRTTRGRANSWIEAVRTDWLAFVASLTTRRRVDGPDVAMIHTPKDFDDAGNFLFGRHLAPVSPSTIATRSVEKFNEAWDPAHGQVGDALDLLATTCRARGATLYAMPAVHILPAGAAPDAYAKLGQQWQAFAATRANALPFLSPGDTDLPLADAYDTEYHVNDHGRRVLTGRIAPALRQLLAGRAASTTVPTAAR